MGGDLQARNVKERYSTLRKIFLPGCQDCSGIPDEHENAQIQIDVR